MHPSVSSTRLLFRFTFRSVVCTPNFMLVRVAIKDETQLNASEARGNFSFRNQWPNNLPAAKMQYLHLFDEFLEEGKRGWDVVDEYLVHDWKRTDKTTKRVLAEKTVSKDKFKELEHDSTMQSKLFQKILLNSVAYNCFRRCHKTFAKILQTLFQNLSYLS